MQKLVRTDFFVACLGIVLMALLNLFNLFKRNGQATSTARQTAVVFACGGSIDRRRENI